MRGRPKKSEVRDEQYRLRLTSSERNKLDVLAKSKKISKSVLIRSLIEHEYNKMIFH